MLELWAVSSIAEGCRPVAYFTKIEAAKFFGDGVFGQNLFLECVKVHEHDEFESLEAKIEELESENDRLKSAGVGLQYAEDELEEAHRENAYLREELKEAWEKIKSLEIELSKDERNP